MKTQTRSGFFVDPPHARPPPDRKNPASAPEGGRRGGVRTEYMGWRAPVVKRTPVCFLGTIRATPYSPQPPYSQFLNSSSPPLTDQSLSTVISDEIPPLTLVLSDNLRRLGP